MSDLYSDFAYDDAFRTIESECDDLLIAFVNYIHGESYGRDAKVIRGRNEHFIEYPDKSDAKRITDSFFEVDYMGRRNKYHYECESGRYDDTLLIRIFEYDTQIALDNSKVTEDAITVSLPHTAILYLRSSTRTPKKLKISIEVPGGKHVSYNVPVVKMKSYTIEQIFEKKLYMLIPFYIFNFEKELPACEKNEEKLKILESKFQHISDKLIGLRDKGEITALEYDTIASLSKDVINQIAKKYKLLPTTHNVVQ